MLLTKFFCEVIPKHSMDESEIRSAEAWVSDYGDYSDIKDDIRSLVYEFGYELVEGAEIVGTNECIDIDPDCLEDRFTFTDDVEW